MDTSKQPKAPANKIRLGIIEAAIWEEDSEKGPRFMVKISRNYKDGSGNWQNTPYLFPDDLLVAAKALDLADTKIRRIRSEKLAQPQAAPAVQGASEDDIPF